ncbi:MAG: MupA/Atu3671 family FMN-dependent luciferase-like monooxygenase [Pseudomonadales bacterium]|jgi:natural product biosynthesis luciferase-like monooxygenase protein|nr:MupA/Atu3671 family FMN-dependent luciferase-like monooxygenase [Pseudomonadales bacterium]
MNGSTSTLHPLTPIQQGMLFHHLAHPGSGVDIEQIHCTIDGALNPEALQSAWQQVVARHPALRSRFLWEEREEPAQEFLDDVFVPVRTEDWRQRSAESRTAALAALLDEDRARGFDLREAPCMRVTAVRTEDERWELLWTVHHMVCDGRSFPLVLSEVFAFHDAAGGHGTAPTHAAPSFAQHVERLTAREDQGAEAFWRERLAGFTAPTPLPAAPVAGEPSGRGEVVRVLDAATTSRLSALCTERGFSLNTLLQGAWALLLGRWSGERDVVFGATRAGRAHSGDQADAIVGCLINTLPVRTSVTGRETVAEWLLALRERERAVRDHEQTPLMALQGWSEVGAGQGLFESLIVFDHQILDSQMKAYGPAFEARSFRLIERTNYPLTLYAYGEPEFVLKLAFDEPRFDAAQAERLLDLLTHVLTAMADAPDAPVDQIRLLSAEDRALLLDSWNSTAVPFPATECIHESIQARVARHPDAPALVHRGRTTSYGELNRRANRLAHHLAGLGVKADVPVAIMLDRGPELLVGLLAIHKAGGCYVPLDPGYPAERLAYMLEDSAAPVLLTRASLEASVPASEARIVLVDDPATSVDLPEEDLPNRCDASNLAYIIYTSGSTGRPKGVMLEHRQVQNFFTAMDARIPIHPDDDGRPGTWLAVTSLSFDISVLELFWTLARGFRVVLHEDRQKAAADAVRTGKHASRPIEFSLMYFSSSDTAGEDRYRLLTEGARFADRNGFTAVWTPERHFHEFGGLFPNPALTTSALAMITERVQLRAGSVVGPLHHPARVAEEWAVADNLSKGRVGIAFASGWQPRDFVLAPQNFGDKQVMFDCIDAVRRLWSGEEVEFPGPGDENLPVRTLPTPVQKELPIWLTAAGSPGTFEAAGRNGYSVLTHLLGQTPEELREKLDTYRRAWKEAGHDGEGHVTLMLHTFVGDDVDAVREVVREPMKAYLGSSLSLVKGFADSWSAFKKRSDGTTDSGIDMDSLTDEELDGLLEYSFERYFETSGLFGDVTTALRIVDDLKGMDIDEIACLIDFGVDEDDVLAHLDHLDRVRRLSQPVEADAEADAEDETIPAQLRRYGVTHMQCTPSLASMLVQEPEGLEALGGLEVMLVGGEAFPQALSEQLRSSGIDALLNMYGPTETTIWSTVHRVAAEDEGVPIGTPIANTRVYVLDEDRQLVPIGVAGELYIGGAGVARGYLGREELTAERFLDDPFAAEPGRMYRTGDLVRWRRTGILEFLGRIDHQVKIRGHRIELGEIEARLAESDGVGSAVVMAREDEPGDVRLVAYVVPTDAATPPDPRELRSALRARLPEAMVPSHFVMLESFPQTPNRKIDRKALPSPAEAAPRRPANVEGPDDAVQARVLAIWQDVLQLAAIDVDENFFDIGGHSLLAVKVQRLLAAEFEKPIGITDLFRFPTVRMLADYLAGGQEAAASQEGQDRGARRRNVMAARRGARAAARRSSEQSQG